MKPPPSLNKQCVWVSLWSRRKSSTIKNSHKHYLEFVFLCGRLILLESWSWSSWVSGTPGGCLSLREGWLCRGGVGVGWGFHSEQLKKAEGGGRKREAGVVLTWHVCPSFEMCVELALLLTLAEKRWKREKHSSCPQAEFKTEANRRSSSNRFHWECREVTEINKETKHTIRRSKKNFVFFFFHFLRRYFWTCIPMLGTITLTGKNNSSLRCHFLHLNKLKLSSVWIK